MTIWIMLNVPFMKISMFWAFLKGIINATFNLGQIDQS